MVERDVLLRLRASVADPSNRFGRQSWIALAVFIVAYLARAPLAHPALSGAGLGCRGPPRHRARSAIGSNERGDPLGLAPRVPLSPRGIADRRSLRQRHSRSQLRRSRRSYPCSYCATARALWIGRRVALCDTYPGWQRSSAPYRRWSTCWEPRHNKRRSSRCLC